MMNEPVLLKEYLVSGNIIQAIKSIEPDSLSFIEDGKESVLNNMLILNHGDKTVYSKFVGLSINELAEMIVTIHLEHWKSLIEFNQLNKPNVINSNKVTETINETGNRTNDNERLNKVSAYNSSDLIVNDGDSLAQNETTQGEKIRTVVDEKTDYEKAYNNLSLSQKNNIIKLAIKDIADFITLSIY